jgi:hypothetical protein
MSAKKIVINGTDGDDKITIDIEVAVLVNAKGGNDTLTSYSTGLFNGGYGDDLIIHRSTALSGCATLSGDGGDDILYSNVKGDLLYGGAGNDYLHFGNNDITAAGGKGADQFLFNQGNGGGENTILDFVASPIAPEHDALDFTGFGEYRYTYFPDHTHVQFIALTLSDLAVNGNDLVAETSEGPHIIHGVGNAITAAGGCAVLVEADIIILGQSFERDMEY